MLMLFFNAFFWEVVKLWGCTARRSQATQSRCKRETLSSQCFKLKPLGCTWRGAEAPRPHAPCAHKAALAPACYCRDCMDGPRRPPVAA